MTERDMANDNLILKVTTGSHLYGTNTADSDKDYTGIFIPDKDYILGLPKCEQVEYRTNPSASGKRNTKLDTDCTLYSLPKFIKLAYDNNPNILEVFFTPEKNIIYCNKFGRRLLQAAPFFISKKIKHTFLGYAISQRRKLMTKNYEGSRQELVDKYGYDTKFAYHLIRLLHEGLELLSKGTLTLPVINADYLKQIKEGKVDLGQILHYSDELELCIRNFVEQSKLPVHANYKKINKLQIQLIEDYWKCKSSYITRLRNFLGI